LKNVILPALCMLMVCGSCSGNEAPSDIVVDSLHAEILIDLHLADARAEVTGEPCDSLRSVALAIHQLDSLALKTILDRYAQHPEEAVALYEQAGEQLATERRGR